MKGFNLNIIKIYSMFLSLNHQNLNIYKVSRQFVIECYKLTKTFPTEEKFGMVTQVRRAALSVHLNLAEGFSRKSENERKRFFEIARGSIIEIDAALDIADELEYIKMNIDKLRIVMIDCFKMISGLIDAKRRTAE